jgi:hypothetical protein
VAPPRHPQANCMVEHLNGHINEPLQQARFPSREDLQPTVLTY